MLLLLHNVVNINGEHRRVGKISDKMLRKLELEGVSKSRFDFLLNEITANEIEQYTGENIDHYGMQNM